MELIQTISLKSLNLSGYRHLDYKILKSIIRSIINIIK